MSVPGTLGCCYFTLQATQHYCFIVSCPPFVPQPTNILFCSLNLWMLVYLHSLCFCQPSYTLFSTWNDGRSLTQRQRLLSGVYSSMVWAYPPVKAIDFGLASNTSFCTAIPSICWTHWIPFHGHGVARAKPAALGWRCVTPWWGLQCVAGPHTHTFGQFRITN